MQVGLFLIAIVLGYASMVLSNRWAYSLFGCIYPRGHGIILLKNVCLLFGSVLSGAALVWLGLTFAIGSIIFWLLLISVLVRNHSRKQGTAITFWQAFGISVVEPLIWYGGVFGLAFSLVAAVEMLN